MTHSYGFVMFCLLLLYVSRYVHYDMRNIEIYETEMLILCYHLH